MSIAVDIKCGGNQRGRGFVFTIPNPTVDDENRLRQLLDTYQPIKMYVGHEIGEGGLIHLQGYINLRNPIRAIKIAQYTNRGFLDVARGTHLQNKEYCLKQGNPMIVHEREDPEEAKLLMAKSVIEKCRTLSLQEIITQHPEIWLRYSNQIIKTKEIFSDQEIKAWNGELKNKNFWLWGEPGTGKTRWATSICRKNTLMKNQNKWWSGYNYGISVVIIDDWNPDVKGMEQYLKIWSDRYSFTAEVKQASMVIHPGTFFLIITSNYSIEQSFDPITASALKRRFKEVQITSQNDIFLTTVPDCNILGYEQ